MDVDLNKRNGSGNSDKVVGASSGLSGYGKDELYLEGVPLNEDKGKRRTDEHRTNTGLLKPDVINNNTQDDNDDEEFARIVGSDHILLDDISHVVLSPVRFKLKKYQICEIPSLNGKPEDMLINNQNRSRGQK